MTETDVAFAGQFQQKHTPGPHRQHGRFIKDTTDTLAGMYVIRQGTKPPGEFLGAAVREEDAKLWAAAPELARLLAQVVERDREFIRNSNHVPWLAEWLAESERLLIALGFYQPRPSYLDRLKQGALDGSASAVEELAKLAADAVDALRAIECDASDASRDMDDADNDGAESRPPDGDDWNDLRNSVMTHAAPVLHRVAQGDADPDA